MQVEALGMEVGLGGEDYGPGLEEDMHMGAVNGPRNGAVPMLWDPWVSTRPVKPQGTSLAGKLFVKVRSTNEVCAICHNLMRGAEFGNAGGSVGLASKMQTSRIYISMELDGYSKETSAKRGLTGDWGSTLSLDVVEYYGPSLVQVCLWESRLWGQDVLLGRFSFPLSDAVVHGVASSYDLNAVPPSPPAKASPFAYHSNSTTASFVDPPACLCYKIPTPVHQKGQPVFFSREPACPLPSSSASPSAPLPPTACCVSFSTFFKPLRRRSLASSVNHELDQSNHSSISAPPCPPACRPVPDGVGRSAEQILASEMEIFEDHPASRRQWYMVKPAQGGSSCARVALHLELQYLPLKTCQAMAKGTGMNELHRAALLGNTEIVEAVLKDVGWSGSCTQRTQSGYTALDYAILRGDLRATHLLLEHSAERFFQDVPPLSPSPLHMAIRSLHLGTHSALLSALRLVSIALESSMMGHRDEEGRTPLALACAMGHMEAAQALIKRFADPAARDVHKNTPLHLAVRCGHLSIVKYLLTLRAPSSSALLPAELLLRTSTSHHLPSTTGHAAAATTTRAALAGLAAQPCAFNEDGDTPLLLAARYGRVEIAKALLKKGVPAIDENKKGRTALHEAALGGHSGIIRLFVDHLLTTLRRRENRRRPNAELRQAAGWLMAQDIYGKSPLALASANGHREVAALLVASGMEVNSLCGVKPSAAAGGEGNGSEHAESEEEDYQIAFELMNDVRISSPSSSSLGSATEDGKGSEEVKDERHI